MSKVIEANLRVRSHGGDVELGQVGGRVGGERGFSHFEGGLLAILQR